MRLRHQTNLLHVNNNIIRINIDFIKICIFINKKDEILINGF